MALLLSRLSVDNTDWNVQSPSIHPSIKTKALLLYIKTQKNLTFLPLNVGLLLFFSILSSQTTNKGFI